MKEQSELSSTLQMVWTTQINMNCVASKLFENLILIKIAYLTFRFEDFRSDRWLDRARSERAV